MILLQTFAQYTQSVEETRTYNNSLPKSCLLLFLHPCKYTQTGMQLKHVLEFCLEKSSGKPQNVVLV